MRVSVLIKVAGAGNYEYMFSDKVLSQAYYKCSFSFVLFYNSHVHVQHTNTHKYGFRSYDDAFDFDFAASFSHISWRDKINLEFT